MQSIGFTQTRQKVAAAVALVVLALSLAISTSSPVMIDAARPADAGQTSTFDTQSTSLRGSTWG